MRSTSQQQHGIKDCEFKHNVELEQAAEKSDKDGLFRGWFAIGKKRIDRPGRMDTVPRRREQKGRGQKQKGARHTGKEGPDAARLKGALCREISV